MVDLMTHFNWTYVSLVYEATSLGFAAHKALVRFTKARDICIADTHAVFDDFLSRDYDLLVNKLMKTKEAKAVVIFMRPNFVHGLLLAIVRKGIQDMFIWILETENLEGLMNVARGAFAVHSTSPIDYDLKEYLDSRTPWLEPDNPWIAQLWKQEFGCNQQDLLTNQTCKERKLSDSPKNTYTPSALNTVQAVYAFAHGIKHLVENECPSAFSDPMLLTSCVLSYKLYRYLLGLEFGTPYGELSFDENNEVEKDFVVDQLQAVDGGYKMREVAKWSKHTESLYMYPNVNLEWYVDGGGASSIPESVCSHTCQPGEIALHGELICCWKCVRCRDNEIITTNGTGCEGCPSLFWPDQDVFTMCLPIAASHLTYTDMYGIGLIVLSIVGLLGTLVIITVIFHYRFRRVVKGATIEMLVVIFAGLILAFGAIPTYVITPIDIVCLFRRVSFNLSCTLMFGALLVKTNRVYQVFSAAARLSRKVYMASQISQMLLLVSIIGLQVRD